MQYLCNYCEEEFDLANRLPFLIKQCGHSICSKCLSSLKKKGKSLICIEDDLEYEIQQTENFIQNFSLIQIIQNANKSRSSYLNEKVSNSVSDDSSLQRLSENNQHSLELQTVQTNKKRSTINQEFSKSKSQFESGQENEDEVLCHLHNMNMEIICRDCAEKCCY